MRRRLLAVLAVFGLLAAACTSGGDESSATGESPSGPVTLTMWHGYTDVEADWFKALTILLVTNPLKGTRLCWAKLGCVFGASCNRDKRVFTTSTPSKNEQQVGATRGRFNC